MKYSFEEFAAAFVKAIPPRDENLAGDNEWIEEVLAAVKEELLRNQEEENT